MNTSKEETLHRRLYRYLTGEETLTTAWLSEEEAQQEQQQCDNISEGGILVVLDDLYWLVHPG